MNYELRPENPDNWIPYLETLMLFLDDEVLRKAAFLAAKFDSRARSLKDTAERNEPFAVPAQEIGDAVEHLRTSYPLLYYQEKMPKRYRWGMAMGSVLHGFVGWNELNPTMARITGLIKKSSKTLNLSISSINNAVLPKFKPVAHLWASHVSFTIDGDMTFPCEPDNLKLFLAYAEAYRKMGEQIIPRQYNRPFLCAEKTWKVPEDIKLPEITLEFARKK